MVTSCRTRLPLVLMVASGFAGLGYQIVWTQQCAPWLGHESAAVLAVVGAFFGGLAAGSFALGGVIERSARPGRWYAGCEAGIAAWSVVLAAIEPAVSRMLPGLIGPQPAAAWQWSIAFGGTFLLLLPATAAMGATLPAMERALASVAAQTGPPGGPAGSLQRDRRRSPLAALYAGNTFGALVGVLATAFWLVPGIGLARTAGACAALNVACAAIALAIFGNRSTPTPSISGAENRWGRSRRLLFATGFLGIGYEVLVVYVLRQVAENTVYTFALILAVYLLGTAIGAAAYQRWSAGTSPSIVRRDRLLRALAAACGLGIASLFGADIAKAAIQSMLGGGMRGALIAEAATAVAAFGLPTIAMGALFSELSLQARAEGVPLGRALGVNTLGAALAPPVFGVVLVPAVGPKAALLVVALGYLLLTCVRDWRAPASLGLAAALGGIGFLAPRLAFVDVPEGGHVVRYEEGAMAAVSVVADADGVRRLRIDNRQQEGSSASLVPDARQALLPILLHPAPRRALFLGLGTGVTAASAAQDAQLQVDAVELLPEVVAASSAFADVVPPVAGLAPRLRVVTADARRYVRAATGTDYDVIVSDNFHPARSGSAALYTVEHFEAVRARLSGHGVFCQWLPLHQLDLGTLRSIVRSFTAVYPHAWAMLATNSLETPVLGLVARRDDGAFDANALRVRLESAKLPAPLAVFGLDDELAVLGSFVAGPASLARFAGDAPPNTDDRPIVAYSAPRIAYAPDSLPRDRLFALLGQLSIQPAELLETPSAGADFPARLTAYWAARNGFLEAGRNVHFSPDVHAMLAQVRDPLLGVLRTSPDFRPAYDPLLRMAGGLARDDPDAARTLLEALRGAQPARPEAQAALDALAVQAAGGP